MLWECMACGVRSVNPQVHSQHLAACKKPKPKGWDHGWQGDTLPVAGRLNQGPTPPGEVLLGWRHR